MSNEQWRDGQLIIDFSVFGKEEHVRGRALKMIRHLNLEVGGVQSVRLDGKELIDTYDDDGGEEWRPLDWKHPDSFGYQDEGMHQG